MKKHKSILGTTFQVSLLIILGKLLGFGREALIAAYYGATAETDAFFFAQSMPGMIFPSICNSISTAFISLYVSKLATESEKDADSYASCMLLATTILGALLSALGVLLSPLIVPLLAPGFSGTQLTLAIRLTQLTMGAFLLTMLEYMLSAILNSKKLFIGTQVTSLLYNGVIIAVTVFLGRGQTMDILTLTVILGQVVQVAALVFCLREHFQFTPRINLFHAQTRQLIHLALPILLGNAAVQINTIVDKALGSILPEGSLSALSYANTLTMLVTSVFVTSLSTVLYPTLTQDAASGDMAGYEKNVLDSLNGLLMVLVPISCITLLTAKDIVNTIYTRGSFNQTASEYTSLALACYAPMFIGVGIREVLTRAFYAKKNTKTPMFNTAIGVFFNIVFSLAFVRYLGIAGIALGTTLSTMITAALLLKDVHKELPSVSLSGFTLRFFKQLFAGALLLTAIFLFRQYVTFPYAVVRFAAASFIGFGVYFAVLLLIDRKAMLDLLNHLMAR